MRNWEKLQNKLVEEQEEMMNEWLPWEIDSGFRDNFNKLQ